MENKCGNRYWDEKRKKWICDQDDTEVSEEICKECYEEFQSDKNCM